MTGWTCTATLVYHVEHNIEIMVAIAASKLGTGLGTISPKTRFHDIPTLVKRFTSLQQAY